jgi:hypothetical protein
MTRKRLHVLIPFRDRHDNLRTLLPVLQRHLRSIPSRIIVVEQADRKPFNKGKLLNAATKLLQQCDYYCFHDVDLVPAWKPGRSHAYGYTRSIVHLAGRCEQAGFKRPYPNSFGGVVLFNKAALFAMNGWSNKYLGWGREDDDLYARAWLSGLPVTFKPYRYWSLPHAAAYRGNHPHFKANCARYERMIQGKIDYLREGLGSVSYRLVEHERREGCDWIRVLT